MSRLQDQIKATQVQLATLQEQLEVEVEASKPWPQIGDECYYISHSGVVLSATHPSKPNNPSSYMLRVGTLYKTREEARRALRKQEARAKLLALIKEANDGWVPDWEDRDQPKYHLYIVGLWGGGAAEGTSWDYTTCYTSRTMPDAYYIRSLDDAERLLDRVTEEFLEDALL